MLKRLSIVVSILVLASMLLSACAPAAAPAPAAGEKKLKICQVTDTGGVDDKSFNETAWIGVQNAVAELGVEGKYLESQEVADYEKNLNAFIEEKCDLIIPVGFFLADATAAAAAANPDVKFSIVDVGFDPPIANVQTQVFNTDEAAFLAGYVAAGVTKTGKIGTFGGFPIPTVTIFMDGLARGVMAYNEKHGTSVEVLGWDPANPDAGLFSSSFDDQTKGKELGISLMDEGADIIMPVAGPVGLGTAAAVQERGNAYIIGVDSDWAVINTQYTPIILTSVMKLMDATVFEAIKSVQDGTYKGGDEPVVGTLENTGVGLAPFHDLDSMVSDELKAEVEALKAEIIAGNVVTGPSHPE
jgi:basic membrane protein A